MQDTKFEIHAIVELFGHNKIAGKVSETTIGGGNFIRIDVPEIPEVPAWTRFLNPSAIYAINPVTEEVATGYARRLVSKPIDTWDAREVLKRMDTLNKLNATAEQEIEEEEEEEEEQL